MVYHRTVNTVPFAIQKTLLFMNTHFNSYENIEVCEPFIFFYLFFFSVSLLKFSFGSDGKASDCNAGNRSSIPGSERCPGEGNSKPLQYPCLENPMDREAW